MELKSLQSFLAIKHCKQTKIRKVIKLAQSSIFKWSHICDHMVGVKLLRDTFLFLQKKEINTRGDNIMVRTPTYVRKSIGKLREY